MIKKKFTVVLILIFDLKEITGRKLLEIVLNWKIRKLKIDN